MHARSAYIAGWMVAALWTVAPAQARQPAGKLPRAFEGVGVVEQPGTFIPRDLVFQDETGTDVTLGTYFDGERPVLLNFVYHDCPMLCSLVLEELTKTMQAMEWVPGVQFEVVTVSFSEKETPDLAARAKARYLARLDRPEAARGWHFLTGSLENIQALTGAVGFQYKWVEEAGENGEYAHPTTLIFLSGDGKVTRYLHGMTYPPRDVRTALVEASEGKVGTTVDKILLYCFHYDPEAGSYVPYAANLMRLGGGVTVLVLGLLLFLLWRRERRRLQAATPSG